MNARNKTNFKKQKYKPDFAKYEFLKKAFVEKNPNSTPEEYQAEMRKYAQWCGI